MSKRDRRREQGPAWKNANSSMSLEETAFIGYDFNIPEPEPDIPENAIVQAEDGGFLYKRFELKPTGIVIPDNLEPDEWHDIFTVLRKLDEAIQWAVGDLANHAESKWSQTYTQMAQVTGYSEKSLREYAYVARSVDLSIRMDNLSFGHHQLVAGMKDPDSKKPNKREQKKWLERASQNGWSIRELREEIAADRKNTKTLEIDNWLFGKDRVPSDTRRLQILWSKARNGDEKARQEAMQIVDTMRDWLDEVVQTLDDN